MLNNGERHTGTIVYGRGDNNIVDLQFHLGTGGGDTTFPMNSVAVIDFVSAGDTPAAESQALPSDTVGLMVMRNGSTQRGRLHNLIRGDAVQWVNEAGQRNDYPIRDVSRLYLNSQAARSAFLTSGVAVGTAGPQVPANAFRVEANQRWLRTGISVRSGDLVSFNATGNIMTGVGGSIGVAGSPIMARGHLPLPSAQGGALIGRVGNSAPFLIGSDPGPIQMTSSGRLELGINDDYLADNSGYFLVAVTPERRGGFRR